MKKLYFIAVASMVLAGLFTSCNNEIEPQEPATPVTPEQPTTGYRLTFDGGVGVENQTRAHWSDLQGSGTVSFLSDIFHTYICSFTSFNI